MKAPSKTKTKKIAEPLLHRAVQYKLAMFLQHYPPREFNREFRNMFIGYLASHNGNQLPDEQRNGHRRNMGSHQSAG